MAAEKKQLPRNLTLMIGTGVIGLLALGAVVGHLMFAPKKDPVVDARTAAQQEAEAKPEADLRDLQARLAERDRELERERAARERAERSADVATGTRGRAEAADARRDDMPEFDPELLEALERADAEVGGRPRLTAGTGRSLNGAGATVAPGAPSASAPAPAAMYESYSKPTITERIADARDTSDEPYEAITPRNPPSDRLITQGANLRAILLTRIDTRNPGDLVAQITSDVYDTATASMVLVPRGSRLVGSYATAVSPGNPRIAVAFRRLIFPDGRAIELPDMAAVGNDGVVGVEGDYRGNLLRAIGPSAMVALIGAWADKEIGAAEQTTTNVGGNTTMAPSVIQQVVPQVNQAVLRRYQRAAPYFVAEPGTSLKVLVSADIHIPVAGGNS